jgi:hypothetical protein
MDMKVAFVYCVSHGDCAVITFEEEGARKCIVIDGGETAQSAAALRAYLESEQVETIDLMVATHIDSDHINGLKLFVRGEARRKQQGEDAIGIAEYWGPRPSEQMGPTVQPAALPPGLSRPWFDHVIESVKQTDDITSDLRGAGVSILHPALDALPPNPFRAVSIDLLGPDTQIPADHISAAAMQAPTEALGTGPSPGIATVDELMQAANAMQEAMAQQADRTANNQSIVLRLSPSEAPAPGVEPCSFLFPGDAEVAAWDRMLQRQDLSSRLPARVLKVPHHGSRNGLSVPVAQAVRPAYSVISVGAKHGLPDADAMQAAQSVGSKILCTHRNDTEEPKSRSDCYAVPAGECPVHGSPQTIVFSLGLAAGQCDVTRVGRACQHCW